MSDEHHHHHHHHHNPESDGDLSFHEKLEKILGHWIRHNEDHASNYRKWAEKAKANDIGKAAILLEEAADMSLEMNDKFKVALTSIKSPE